MNGIDCAGFQGCGGGSVAVLAGMAVVAVLVVVLVAKHAPRDDASDPDGEMLNPFLWVPSDDGDDEGGSQDNKERESA